MTELEGITIYSANRTPTEAAKVGSSVEVLTEKDLEKQSKTFLKDYLEQLPGVNFVQNGPPGTTSGISLRGANAPYVKVLVDGMDVSDPSAPQTSTAFEHLLVGDVSRIEVLKGSQSTLYGGDAVAGVITIETKRATKPGFSHSGGAEYGAYNTYRGAYTAGYAATDGSNISLSVQGINTDGFSAVAAGTEDDGYENLTISGRGEYFITPSAKIFFAARTVDADGEYDRGFAPLADNLDSSTTVQHAGRVGTEFSLLDGAFQNTFAVQGMKLERENFGSYPITFEGERVKGEYKGVLTFNDRLSLLAGSDWERTEASSTDDPVNHSVDLTGFYAQLMMEPIDGLMLTGGGRIDDHSEYGDFKTHRLTAAYLIPGTETKFRGSYGTGFRSPSLYELFDPYSGNTALKPETSKGWDVGLEQGFQDGRYKLGATYFELDTENLIQYSFVSWSYEQIPGVTRRKGVELSGAAVISSGFVVTAGYTYVEAEEADGDRLARVPRHNFVVGVDLQPMDKVELNVTAKYLADSLDNGLVELDDYVLVSAKASYEFIPGWKAYVRGENLLDEDYQTTTGYNTPGLSVYGGLTMSLPNN